KAPLVTHAEHLRNQQQHYGGDPYKTALHAVAAAAEATRDDVELTVDYLAPMTTVFPESTLLLQTITAGYPNTPYRSSKDNSTYSAENRIWAFAVTSQNAVHAIEEALRRQPDAAIREAWLEVPMYCLTGATLASVQRVGFKTINSRNFMSAPAPESSAAQFTIPSFDNGVQLVEFLISLTWPKDGDNKGTVPPELWFLTGEMHMKTLGETLTAHQKPYREIVVYETGPRPLFEKEFWHWLTDTSGLSVSGNDDEACKEEAEEKKRLLYLVGFSPRGVDIAIPTLRRFLEAAARSKRKEERSARECGCEVRWGAIGQTTAKRIQEHLATLTPEIEAAAGQTSDVVVVMNATVAVAKAPKPEAVAEAILS
ncbi:hypothetical protein BGZ54_009686, partial [Gamsiella multidivaricata]